MTPEDIINPNEGNRPQHPEVAENPEAAMPASEQSKRDLLEAIDGQLERRSTREGFNTGEVRKGRDLVDASGNPLTVTRYLSGREDNRVADVIQTVFPTEGGREVNRYEISKIPDGLSVEKLFHSWGASDSAGIVTELPRDPKAVIEAIDDQVAKLNEMVAAQEQERELGLTFASEKDVKAITQIIQEARPHEDEKEDLKFLRQERRAKSIEGKTEKDEAGRETDVAKAEFMANAMNLDMMAVVDMVSDPSPNEEMIDKLEAQAERKAIKAKAAYESGVRSLVEVFGEDSREGMAEQGWRWLTNVSTDSAQSDFDFGGEGEYLSQLQGRFGNKNVITKPAYNIYDKPAPGMIGVFVKQDAWENHQKSIKQ